MKKIKVKENKLEKRKDRSFVRQFNNFIKVYASSFDFFNDQNL